MQKLRLRQSLRKCACTSAGWKSARDWMRKQRIERRGWLESLHDIYGMESAEIQLVRTLKRNSLEVIVAVRVGFEPTVPFRVQRFSRPADSTTLAPHRYGYFNIRT